MSNEMSLDNFSLHIGKTDDGGLWLCIANADSNEVYRLAQFCDQLSLDTFTAFMEQEGYLALRLPTKDELDKFFE